MRTSSAVPRSATKLEIYVVYCQEMNVNANSVTHDPARQHRPVHVKRHNDEVLIPDRRRRLGWICRNAGRAAIGDRLWRHHLFSARRRIRCQGRVGWHARRDGTGFDRRDLRWHPAADLGPLRAGRRRALGFDDTAEPARLAGRRDRADAVPGSTDQQRGTDPVRCAADRSADQVHAVPGCQRLPQRCRPHHHPEPVAQVAGAAQGHGLVAGLDEPLAVATARAADRWRHCRCDAAGPTHLAAHSRCDPGLDRWHRDVLAARVDGLAATAIAR